MVGCMTKLSWVNNSFTMLQVGGCQGGKTWLAKDGPAEFCSENQHKTNVALTPC